MKTQIVILLFLLLGNFLNAQVTPIEIIATAPTMPTNVDVFKVKDDFKTKVSRLMDTVAGTISQMKKDAKEADKGKVEKISNNMAKDAGADVSAADKQKMKSGKMSKAETQAMADKMMQQMANMSMDETKNTKNLSKEGKDAYAQGLSTEMMATQQANPDKNQAQQKRDMNIAELAQEQSTLAHKIQARHKKFEDQLAEFQKFKEPYNLAYNKCMEETDNYITSYGETNKSLGSDLDGAEMFRKCLTAYFGSVIPKYKGILREFFDGIIAAEEDYNRLEELEFQMEKGLGGGGKTAFKPGLKYLEALQEYLTYLRAVPEPLVTINPNKKKKDGDNIQGKDKDKVVE